MILKIVTTGAESSGKTSLAKALALAFNEPWVPEYSRDYIDQLSRPYRQEDLIEIARGQVVREDEYARKAKQMYFCDTSIEVIKIWSEYKYQNCDPQILELFQSRKADLYLLCAPDVPWEYDPQRENPNDREELFHIYKSVLKNEKHFEMWGEHEKRLQEAILHIERLIP